MRCWLVLFWLSFVMGNPQEASNPLQENLEAIARCRDGLQACLDDMDRQPALFPEKRMPRRALTEEESAVVTKLWTGALEQLVVLNHIATVHKDFLPQGNGQVQLESLLICDAAFVATYRFSLVFCTRVRKNPSLNAVLDDPVEALGIPAGTFSRMRARFLSPVAAGQFAAMRVMREKLDTQGLLSSCDGFMQDEAAIFDAGKGHGHLLNLDSAVRSLEKIGFEAWLDIQKPRSERAVDSSGNSP